MKKIFEGCLLLTDMDGTLIHSPNPVAEENKAAIERFIELGGKFAIATGRSPINAFKYLNDVKLNAPSILFNGGMIFNRDTKETIREHFMPAGSSQQIESIAKDFKDLGVELINGTNSYRTSNNDIISTREKKENISYIDIMFDKIDFDYHKAILGYSPEKMQGLKEYVNDRIEDFEGIEFVNSSDFYLEVMPKGVNKGTALIELAEILNISRENVFAIGDFHNDIDMLREAGISAAPESGHPDILAMVDVVVGDYRKHAIADFVDY